jgi:hypothetical protein
MTSPEKKDYKTFNCFEISCTDVIETFCVLLPAADIHTNSCGYFYRTQKEKKYYGMLQRRRVLGYQAVNKTHLPGHMHDVG